MLEVQIFTIRGCEYCANAVAQARGVPWVNVVQTGVDGKPEVREWLARQTTSRTLPSVWVRGTYIGGFETGPPPFGGLKHMITSGRLGRMSEEHYAKGPKF
jgi:glutaredoxin